MALAISVYWYVGWIVGVVVVALAAGLLLMAIMSGRKIAGQAGAITGALDGARENTAPLFDVGRTNLAVDRITRGLARARGGGES